MVFGFFLGPEREHAAPQLQPLRNKPPSPTITQDQFFNRQAYVFSAVELNLAVIVCLA